MSPSPETERRTLSIDAGSPTAEIFVINSDNTVVARGVQYLQQILPVGIYKVRFRIGNTVADKLIELPIGTGFYTPPELPELPLVSPVPLGGPAGSPQSLISGLASTWSTTVHVSHGQGSRIFLFVDASTNPSQPIAPGDVILRTFAGLQIATLSAGLSGEGCFGCTIELDPGGYILEVQRGESATVQQAVYTAPGLETQVFLPVAPQSQQNCIPDLSACAMLMSPISYGFRPDSQSFRWAEAARKTLSSGRMGVTPAQQLRGMQAVGPDDPMIEGMLAGKFLSPMLGIYGAHLMAAQNNSDNDDLIREVVTNLNKLVGELPDVSALRLYLGDPSSFTLSFSYPPMLAASWALIVKHSPNSPNLVPTGSFSAHIAGSLWGSGAWLGWKISEGEVNAVSSSIADVDWDLLTRSARDETSQILHANLNPAERAVMSYVRATGTKFRLPSKLALASSPEPDNLRQITPSGITSATGIPFSVVVDAAASLTRKLIIPTASSKTQSEDEL
jgi:hypothetical protein